MFGSFNEFPFGFGINALIFVHVIGGRHTVVNGSCYETINVNTNYLRLRIGELEAQINCQCFLSTISQIFILLFGSGKCCISRVFQTIRFTKRYIAVKCCSVLKFSEVLRWLQIIYHLHVRIFIEATLVGMPKCRGILIKCRDNIFLNRKRLWKKNHNKLFMKKCFSCCKVITKWSPKRNSLFLFKIYTLIVDNFLFWLSEHWEFYILSVDNLSNNFNLIIRILRIFWFNFASNLIKIKT